MSKYIIKNCPAYSYLGKECHMEEGQYGASCCEVTDCVMKQVIGLAKGYKEELIDRETGEVVATRYFKLAKEILELLDIQEVE